MRKLLKFAYNPKDPRVLVKYERQAVDRQRKAAIVCEECYTKAKATTPTTG